eukprot:4959475-Pleurochrysis_carterae.AAC.1
MHRSAWCASLPQGSGLLSQSPNDGLGRARPSPKSTSAAAPKSTFEAGNVQVGSNAEVGAPRPANAQPCDQRGAPAPTTPQQAHLYHQAQRQHQHQPHHHAAAVATAAATTADDEGAADLSQDSNAPYVPFRGISPTLSPRVRPSALPAEPGYVPDEQEYVPPGRGFVPPSSPPPSATQYVECHADAPPPSPRQRGQWPQPCCDEAAPGGATAAATAAA